MIPVNHKQLAARHPAPLACQLVVQHFDAGSDNRRLIQLRCCCHQLGEILLEQRTT